ncbi:MFS transporter [Roseomonas haemaphysalidis]|uniref:MFS transporter n=1 Tax=Roseomonas haemaphysalidis TaxID=2768162 RepID=A0ABS3KYJ3_9PROT|nr:MFS transporter [Roseomonas haemaphysalidis]MBO1081708.1 MFS transporter [Roseomonas haemaphysalidis]
MPAAGGRSQRTVVLALGTAQTLAWASTYYLPAVLADPVSAELGLSREWFFGIFSAALLLSGLLGPAAGRAIDRRGGRSVLALSNLIFAAGLVILAASTGIIGLSIAWIVLGVGMAFGLYDAAFATLAGLYRADARGAITGITLLAGFASTVGWPVTALFTDELGWRGACIVWAVLHLALGLPLNRLLVPPAPPPEKVPAPEAAGGPAPWAMIVLAGIFAATLFVSAALAAHLPRLLQAAGATPAAAVAAAALLGPAQVMARMVEYSLQRHLSALAAARMATALHPLGALGLAAFGAPAAAAFALLHGAGNGMLTIAKGVLPLALFGAAGYGMRIGMLSAPGRVLQAAAPLVFGIVLDRFGPVPALLVSGGLSMAALAGLLVLHSGAPLKSCRSA